MSETRLVVGNLRFGWSGSVWADFILEGLPYGVGRPEMKWAAQAQHQLLFRSLIGEATLLGVIAQEDPAVIVDQMLEGVDLDQCPQWREECLATLDTLDQIMPGKRVYYLSVPLRVRSWKTLLSSQLGAITAWVRNSVSMPWVMPSEVTINECADLAETIASALPPGFAARPATASQMVWMQSHACRRSLPASTGWPQLESMEESLLTPSSGVLLGGAQLEEGGDDPASRSSSQAYLKVSDGDALQGQASFQSMLAVASFPDEMPLLGSEILEQVDVHQMPVDFALRLSTRPREKSQRKNQTAEVNIKEQLTDAGAQNGASWGRQSKLGKSARALSGLMEALEESSEVEILAIMVFAVSAPTAAGAVAQARQLTKVMKDQGVTLSTRWGLQVPMWWAMQPAVPTPAELREYSQIATSKTLAATMPLVRNQIGDDNGVLAGVSIPHAPLLEGGVAVTPAQAVLMDLDGAADRQLACSIVTGGMMGYGKTATLMTIAGHIVDRGGQLVMADRTKKGEWATWAQAVTGAQIINLRQPALSADPLRVLGPRDGAEVLASTMATLLRVGTTTTVGAMMAKTLAAGYLERHRITSTPMWVEHLRELAPQSEAARDLLRTVEIFVDTPLARVLFDPDLPPLDLSAGAIVFRTESLTLPTHDEIITAHLFESLPVEKIVSRAFYSLIMWTARTVAFRDTSRLTGFFSSEAWASVSSTEAQEALSQMIRDGRKHRCVVGLDSQNPLQDLPDATLRALITWRLMFHCDSASLATDCARFLLEGSDESASYQGAELEEVAAKIRELSPRGRGGSVPLHRRGESIIRTPYDTDPLTRIKVLLPSSQQRASAIITAGNAATPVGRGS